MLKDILVFFFLTALLSAINYVVTFNLITTIIVFALSFLYFFFICLFRFKKHNKRLKDFKENYSFINAFIIALSVKENLNAAYEMTLVSMNEDFNAFTKGIAHLEVMDQLHYLEKYFNFDSYTLFLSLIELYQDRGGDILKMSKYLIDELRNNYNYVLRVEGMRPIKYFEFASLWFFTLLILIVMRFALNDFYSQLVNQVFFYTGVLILFIFLLFSIDILVSRSLKIDVKGWKI